MKMLFNLILMPFLLLTTLAVAKSDSSLFDLNNVWKTDGGKELRLKDFGGKRVILSMAYTNCSTACPLIVNLMSKLTKEASKEKNDLHFVIVSLDPARDSSQTLAHFKKRMKVDYPNWTLLVGDEAHTRRLAVALGLNYSRVDGSDEIMHDNLLVLLDDEGRIVRKINGLSASLKDFFPEAGAQE